MSTRESWRLTPREFEARRKVRETYMAQQIAENRNAAHQLQKQDKSLWHPFDFLHTKEAIEHRAQKSQERNQMSREAMRGQSQAAAMKAGTFDDSELPEWARMTEEEKRRPN